MASYRPLRDDADVHKGLSRQREHHQLKFCLELLEIVRSLAQLTICTMLRKKKKKDEESGEKSLILPRY